MTTYTIAKIRVVTPTETMREKHPDRAFTVFGQFFNEKGDKLSITNKVITTEDILHPEFNIDVAKGLLTIHSGERGRKAAASITQNDVNDILTAIRKSK